MGDSTGSEEAIIRLLQSSTSLALSKDPNSHRRQLKLITIPQDLSAAFDIVDHDKLLAKLRRMKLGNV